MLRIKFLVCVLLLLHLAWLADSVSAAESKPVRWFNDANEAWRTSQAQRRPLLIFVTRTDCVPCARMKLGTYSDRAVAATINDRFIALTIDAARPSPLLKDLAINAYPATFVISPEAVILQRIDGFITPEQMSAHLAKIPLAANPKPAIRTVSERAF